jgi:hypothetical protein
MKCDYTCSNHNFLVLPKKKVATKGMIIKGVLNIEFSKSNNLHGWS